MLDVVRAPLFAAAAGTAGAAATGFRVLRRMVARTLADGLHPVRHGLLHGQRPRALCPRLSSYIRKSVRPVRYARGLLSAPRVAVGDSRAHRNRSRRRIQPLRFGNRSLCCDGGGQALREASRLANPGAQTRTRLSVLGRRRALYDWAGLWPHSGGRAGESFPAVRFQRRLVDVEFRTQPGLPH
jgi:hypothetical protein